MTHQGNVVNIDHLRQSLKTKWLNYYQHNRSWLARLDIWVTRNGQRRPSSSFILGTITVLEPQLTQLMPLVVDLSRDTDHVVAALGLNFNPDRALDRLAEIEYIEQEQNPQEHWLLPEPHYRRPVTPIHQWPQQAAATQADETCSGSDRTIDLEQSVVSDQ